MTSLLTGCGPENSRNNQEALAATTQQIALDYQSHRNLDQATAELEALDVANLNQWLLYTTETAVNSGADTTLANALVLLSTDLGLQSNSIHTYALQNNLIAAAVALAPPVVVDTQPTPETAAALPTTEAGTQKLADAPPATTAENAQSLSSASVLTATPALPVAVIITPTLTPVPPVLAPQIKASSDINVRSGPGTEYVVMAALVQSETADITGKNLGGDWWEVRLANGQQGWVYSPLVETAGDTTAIAVAANIPTPPPTFTPAPTPEPLPVAAVEEPTPEEAAPPAEQPAEQPAAGGPDFRVVQKRLWDVVENGGQLNGPSVTCGEKRQLVVELLDAAGNRLNGVAVQALYGAQEVFVSGSQGKGDGIVEFVLGGGQALKVIRDADGREVVSEEVYGLSTKPWEIPFETLIGGNFCSDDASCQSFVDQTGCYGHYSWTVTFQRAY